MRTNGRTRRGASASGGRREGFILVSALIIMLVGSYLILALFTLSTSFNRTALMQRQAYRDQLDAMGYVEGAKGFILARTPSPMDP